MKKIQLKKEMSEYITVDEWRFVNNSLDKRILNELELPYENITKRPNHNGVVKDSSSPPKL